MTCRAAVNPASVPAARRAPEIPLALRNGALFPVGDPLGFLAISADPVECPLCHRLAAFFHLSQSEELIAGLDPWRWACLRCVGGDAGSACGQ